MRPFIKAFALSATVSLAGCSDFDHAAGVATGLVSHQLCSASFIAGNEPEAYYAEGLAPVMGPLAGLVSHEIDPKTRSVTARLLGMYESRAVYRGDGLGCVVLRGAPPSSVRLAPASASPALLPAIAGPDVVAPADPALSAALDRAFAEPAAGPHRGIKAAIIVHDGRIVAERYAPGYGVETPLIGWSLTKSVMNALAGILVRQGRLDMNAPAPIKEWTDARRAITPDNLLRMTSGLDLGDSLNASVWSAFDFSIRAMFDERDVGRFAAGAKPIAAPGTKWTYADGSTFILSRIVRDLAGGDTAAVTHFARRNLFEKLGMSAPVLEMDATGTPLGASHMWAPARDWAKLGLLYLNDGVVGGERILPEGWVDYSARLTPGSEWIGYGAGFWTNHGASNGSRKRISFGMPADAFMGRGMFGQFLIIVPSQRLVVVQMGPSDSPGGDIEGVGRLVADAIAALAARRTAAR